MLRICNDELTTLHAEFDVAVVPSRPQQRRRWLRDWPTDSLPLLHAAATTAANAFRLHCSASCASCHACCCCGVRCSIGERTDRPTERPALLLCLSVLRWHSRETMLTRCSRQPALSSCRRRRTCFVDVLRSLYCCCCCYDISVSLLLFAGTLCLSFVTSLAIVTDASTPRTPGNRLIDRCAKHALKYETTLPTIIK